MMTYPFIENYCRRKPIRKSYSRRLEELRRALDRADHVAIGAGAGLSAAAGLEYSGRRFTDNFGDFNVVDIMNNNAPLKLSPAVKKVTLYNHMLSADEIAELK